MSKPSTYYVIDHNLSIIAQTIIPPYSPTTSNKRNINQINTRPIDSDIRFNKIQKAFNHNNVNLNAPVLQKFDHQVPEIEKSCSAKTIQNMNISPPNSIWSESNSSKLAESFTSTDDKAMIESIFRTLTDRQKGDVADISASGVPASQSIGNRSFDEVEILNYLLDI